MAMTEVAQATVTIIPNMKGSQATISKELDASVGSAGESAGKSLGTKLIGTLGKIGVAAGIGKLIKDSVAEGANLQQSFGGLDTLYGDAAEAAKQYAFEAAAAGISANDYAEQAVSFGASLKAAFGGDTAKAAEAANTAIMDMTDNAAKMGTPIESIQNAYQGFAKGQYNMLDNLKLGYGGTKTEMERLLADASKLSGVEYNIDNLGDVYDAIHVIQEDLGLTGVAAEEASTTFSGSFGAMKAAAANVLGKLALGESIGPSLKALGDSIKTFLVNNALPMIGNVITQIPSILAQIPSFVGDLLPDLVAGAANIVVNLAQGIITNIPVFIASIGQMFSSIWTAVQNIDWSAVGATIVSLIAAAWEALKESASMIWDAIVGIFTGDVEFPSLASLAYSAWSGLITLASTIWNAVVDWFTSTFSFANLDELASAAWSTLTGIASGIWSGITGIFGAADISFSDVSEAASTAWGAITTAATSVWDGIKGIFGSFDITWPDFGALAQGALDGLKSAAEGVWNWVKGLFSGSSDDDAVKSVQGSTSEMAATLADAELQISSVDVSSIQEANTFVSNTVLGWMRIFEGMKSWMVLPTPSTSNLQSVSQVISSWISTWKRQMQFTWTLPTPHGYLPSFSVSMREAGDGTTRTSYPVFTKSLQWFEKGGIFDAPTVIGVGESGSEAVVPLDKMWQQMSAEFDEHSSPVQVTNYFTVDGAEDPERWATRAARTLKLQLRMA